MNEKSNVLRKLMEEVFRLKWEGEDLPQYAELLEKFVFHMLDASSDVHHLAEKLKNCDRISSSEFAKSLHDFFLHAVPHLTAAGQIYDFVPRLFAEQDGVHSLPIVAEELERDN